MSKTTILTNAFSINMIAGTMSFRFTQIPAPIAAALFSVADKAVSAVGHADTAALFSKQLGIEVPCNRVTVEVTQDTRLIVGQYKGPRLPEGCHTLPEGAMIEWWKVTPIDWEEECDFYEGRS